MSVIGNKIQTINKDERKVSENFVINNITNDPASVSLLHANLNPPIVSCLNANLTIQSSLINDLSPISSIQFSREMVSQFSFLESDEENEIQQIPRKLFLFVCFAVWLMFENEFSQNVTQPHQFKCFHFGTAHTFSCVHRL